MPFVPDNDQAMLRDSVRRFMKSEVAPLVAAHDRAQTFPFEILEGLAQFGYVGGRLPEADGGMGLDHVTWAMLMEEAGYTWLSLRTMLNITNGGILKVASEGTPEQKARFLAPLLRCARRCCTAISEPGTGSNIAQIQTRADLVGDDYVINGRKLWITNGAFADFAIVVARTFSPTCDGALSTFIVERDVSPYEVRRVETMVLRSTGTAELTFDNVRVPRANLLGAEGSALKRMLKGLDAARVNIAMGAVGAAQAALDLSIDYARTRTQFGRPIGSFQLVQKHIVDMTIRVEAARALGYRAAAALDADHDARTACSIAKLYATEAAHEVADMALQVHGGLGYATDYPIERIFRDTRGGTIPEGTTEVQTLIVGREILGMSALA
ncbi:alkylation response protein AidB-like acyl-CoA dehydrogenase [Cupriavidus gilardii J11]|uniref:Alkylation response protein AidB-like acyl-CoA dehydrogenase n=1 Tax=Cupriavidus gilardii J11 TaxID=936133 RepID=A0A562BUC9_9BURK|nr:acyl-CoA dehydrogenase [Cupriavidus gilardii]TWG88865.1 alkylation response protein AidB-like acyl-CoA dehydrogenase [Cupriavidus gilardii J11]